MLVVRNIGGHGYDDWLSILDPGSGEGGDTTQRLIILSRPDCRACRINASAAVQQRRGESSTTGGKQDLSFRRHDDQFQAMVADEGIIQMQWKDIQIGRRTNLFEGMLGKLSLIHI